MNEVQKITLEHAGRVHWFEVHRYESQTEFEAALIKAGVRFGKDTVAHTDCYPNGDECGRMWLLDKSIGTLAKQATLMAWEIMNWRTDNRPTDNFHNDLAGIVSQITSELYSKNRHF